MSRSSIDVVVLAKFNSTVCRVLSVLTQFLISTEYADLDLLTAAMLVNNAKQTTQAVQPPAPAYGYNPPMPQYSQPAPSPFPPVPAAQPSNISNIISSLDPSTLSQLLGAMSQQNIPQNTQPAPGLNADLARLLASVSGSAQTPGFGAPAQPQLPQLPQLGQPQYSALAAMLGGQPQPTAPPVQTPTQSPGGAPDMNEIMAQLAKYQR